MKNFWWQNKKLQRELRTIQFALWMLRHAVTLFIGVLEKMNDSIKALQASVERNASDAKALIDKNAALTQENATLTQSNTDLAAQNTALEGKISDLQAQLTAATDTTALDTTRGTLDNTNTSIETALGTGQTASPNS